MWTYLWDIVDEGYENVLGRLKDNKLTSVSLATAYHAGKFLAPHNPKEKVVFLEDGTVYFQPTSSLYHRIQPRVNSLVNRGEGLEKLRSLAEHRGLETRAWVVCCHNTPLGMQYPDIACRDVFGDAIYHNLCPSNPDVRSYLGSLVKDIASKGVTVIELEAMQFQGYTHGFHHEREGIPLAPVIRYLLGLCFCPSCVHRAAEVHYSLNDVEQFARKTLETYFANPRPEEESLLSIERLPDDLFAPFHAWRKSVVTSLAQELVVSVEGTSARLRPLVSLDATARTMVAMDPASVASITGRILVPGYVKDGEALRKPLQTLQTEAGKHPITVGFQVGLPGSGGEPEFLSRMDTAWSMGIRNFNYYNYGLIPLRNLGWIKESLAVHSD